jgi:tetratricopeptide (TPR) repeat protein
LTVEADSRSPERGQYAFVQALIREVAYNQLARAERKSRHLAAARWFESIGDQELAGALAEHYAAAFRNAPAGPEADALAGQARIALRAAADRAAKLGSRNQAVGYLKQALEITDEPAERAAILERMGREASDGTPELALGYHQQALTAYRDLGDLLGAARAAAGQSIVLHYLSRPGDAIPVLEQIAGEMAGREAEPNVVRMLAELTRAYANSGHPKALETADRVLTLAERMDDIDLIVEALINRSLVLVYSGRHHESTALLRGVLALAEANDLVWPELRALNNLASELQTDDVHAALGFIERAMDLSRRTGSLGSLRYFQAGWLGNQFDLGEWEAMLPLLAELEEEAKANPTGGWVLDYLYPHALSHAYRGQHESAAAVVNDIRHRMAAVSHVEYVTASAWVEAQVAALAGRLAEAQRHAVVDAPGQTSHSAVCASWLARVSLWTADRDHARQAVERLESAGAGGRIAGNLRREARAVLDALSGERDKASVGYSQALAKWRELDLPVYIGLCLTDMAIAFGTADKQGQAAGEEARAIWTRLGSPPMLARLDEATTGGVTAGRRPREQPMAAPLERSAAG